MIYTVEVQAPLGANVMGMMAMTGRLKTWCHEYAGVEDVDWVFGGIHTHGSGSKLRNQRFGFEDPHSASLFALRWL